MIEENQRKKFEGIFDNIFGKGKSNYSYSSYPPYDNFEVESDQKELFPEQIFNLIKVLFENDIILVSIKHDYRDIYIFKTISKHLYNLNGIMNRILSTYTIKI